MAMEPHPRNAVGVVFSALLITVMLWFIIRIIEAVWLPLLIILLIIASLGVGGWLLYRRTRRW